MTDDLLDKIRREREQLRRDIAQRQKQIDRDAELVRGAEEQTIITSDYDPRYDRATVAQPVVTRSMPAPQPGGAAGFTARELSLIEAVMSVVGEGLAEQREKAHDDLRRVEQELRHALERKVEDRKLDRIASELRSEILTERLAHERELRAIEARFFQGSRGSGAGLSVLDMKEIN